MVQFATRAAPRALTGSPTFHYLLATPSEVNIRYRTTFQIPAVHAAFIRFLVQNPAASGFTIAPAPLLAYVLLSLRTRSAHPGNNSSLAPVTDMSVASSL